MQDDFGDPHPKEFLTYQIARLHNKLNAQAIRILRASTDLALTEWRIMALTSRRSNVTLSRIAEESDLDKGQLSRAASSMTRKGYLVSELNSADHRQSFLRLTPRGLQILDAVIPAMRARQGELSDVLTQEEERVFFRVLEKLSEAAKKEL